MAEINVRNLRFISDAGTFQLDKPEGWRQVLIGIGSNIRTAANIEILKSQINLVAEADGAAFKDMPDVLPVELISRSPNQAGGKGTLNPKQLELRKISEVGGITSYTLFGLRWDDLDFKKSDSVPEVATVMRQDEDERLGGKATAADRFKNALAYNGRGFARQPLAAQNPDKSFYFEDSGDHTRAQEVPPSETITVSGGVEVLEARVRLGVGRAVTTARALVRSPADVWFYSGHGFPDGNLVVRSSKYVDWKTPGDFLKSWADGERSRTSDMKILIINGCNVLNLDVKPATKNSSAINKPALMWRKLLKSADGSSGNLTLILGYSNERSAPLDSQGGAQIAEELGRAISAGQKGDQLIKTWIEEINVGKSGKGRNLWYAVAMDDKGYHFYNRAKHGTDVITWKDAEVCTKCPPSFASRT